MKRNHIKEFMVKLLALSLAIVMAFPVNIFASSQTPKNYNHAPSVMEDEESERTDSPSETSLFKSEVTVDETIDYRIEKSANLSKATGKIDYRIAVKSKTTPIDKTEKLIASFATASNTDFKELKLDRVTGLDKNNNEAEIEYEKADPNGLLDADKSIDSLAIKTKNPEVGVVYYLSAQLDQKKIQRLEKESPILALDMVFTKNDNPIYESRYSLEAQSVDNLNEQVLRLQDDNNISLVKGLYKDKNKKVFGYEPATITWSDYILSSDSKPFTYDFNLDDSQTTDESKIKIDFYQATDKGFVLNKDFSQELPFSKSIKLTIPQGQIAKVEVSTIVKENTNSKTFDYNNTQIINPNYEAGENRENQDKISNNFSKNKSRSNTSNNIITDQTDHNFSGNPKSKKEDSFRDNFSKKESKSKSPINIISSQTDRDFSRNPKNEKSTSAIELNKDSLLTIYKKEDKLDESLEDSINKISDSLQDYNDGEIDWENFVEQIKKVTSTQRLEKSEFEDIIKSLISGLDEKSYKVSNINLKDLTKRLYININSVKETKVDKLVEEKLKEKDLTIEDFQNYMYDLEEKYGLTDADADKIYTKNADTIKRIIEKSQKEKTTGDVFAVTDGFKNKKFLLISNMNTLTIPGGNIPSGRYFDIESTNNIGLAKNKINDLYDENNNLVARAKKLSEYKIRYTFEKNISADTSVPIKQMYDFMVTDNNPTTVGFTIIPQNGPRQYLPGLKVYPESNNNPSEDSNGVVKSLYITDKWTESQAIGTHISKDIGDNIRYSFVKSNDFVNTYEKAIADYKNADLSYYIWLRPEVISQISNDSDITINMAKNGKIDDVSIYKIPYGDTEKYKDALKKSTILTKLGELENITDKNSVNFDDNKSNITLRSTYTTDSNKDSYIIKVKAKDVKPNVDTEFSFKWSTKNNGTIDNLSNPYYISTNYEMPETPSDNNSLNFEYEDKIYKDLTYTDGRMIFDDEKMTAYCINLGIPNPFQTGGKYYQKAIVNPSPELFARYAFPKGLPNAYKNRDNVQMYYDIKRAIYLIEQENWEKAYKDHVTQAVIARIIDVYTENMYRISRKSKEIDPSVYDKNSSKGKILEEDGSASENRVYNDNPYGGHKTYKKEVNDIFFSIPDTKDITNKEKYISYETLDKDVEIKVYHSFDTTTDKLVTDVQNIITYEVKKTPRSEIKFKKVFSDNGKYGVEIRENLPESDDKNAYFTLYDQNGNSYHDSKYQSVSDDNVITFTNLPTNQIYTLKEQAPIGYNRSEEYIFGIDENGNIQAKNFSLGDPTTIVNSKTIKAKFAIKKVDSQTNELLQGAEFTLGGGDLTKDIVKTTSEEENPIIFDNLKANENYTLKETKVPTGYKNENLEWNVKVDPEGQVSIEGINGIEEDGLLTFTIKNSKEESKNGRFEVLKVDDSDNKLDGAEFTIYEDSDLEKILTLKDEKQVKTTSGGQITFDNLPQGTYYLKESKAPKGYIIESTIWTVIVENGIATISSDNKDNEKFIITNSKDDEKISQVKVINHKPTYPSTGGSGPKIAFAIGGTALMLLALMYYGIYQNDKTYKRSKTK